MKSFAYAHALVVAHWQHHHHAGTRIITRALELASTVTIVMGSAHRSRNVNHPFTWQQREELIRLNFSAEDNARLRVKPLADHPDDDVWCKRVIESLFLSEGQHVVLVQGEDDPTAEFYGESFPSFDVEPVECSFWDVDSLRQEYFGDPSPHLGTSFLEDVLSSPVRALLARWRAESWYQALVAEQAATQKYKRDWPGKWHETADAVVTCAGHVLLIRRKSDFGNGLLALPGGFVNEGEMFFPASLRELREETTLRLALPEARRTLRGCRSFEHPLRSPRGRLVTHAYHYDLGDVTPPAVRAADDAKEAVWVLQAALHSLREQFFEDHPVVIEHFLGDLEVLATKAHQYLHVLPEHAEMLRFLLSSSE